MKVNEIIGFFVSESEGYHAYYHTKIEDKSVIIRRRLVYNKYSRNFIEKGKLFDYIITFDVRL